VGSGGRTWLWLAGRLPDSRRPSTRTSLGAKVVVLEKASQIGGSARKGSLDVVSEQSVHAGAGVADRKDDALVYMARMARPLLFDRSDPFLASHSGSTSCSSFCDNADNCVPRSGGVSASRSSRTQTSRYTVRGPGRDRCGRRGAV